MNDFFPCLFSYGIWPFNFFKKLGIPGPQPLPFVGTFLEYRHVSIWGQEDPAFLRDAFGAPSVVSARTGLDCFLFSYSVLL